MTQRFEGFPPGVRATPVPSPLLGPLLAQVDDLGELKVVLRAVALLHGKRGFPRYLTLGELAADPVLAQGLPPGATVPEAVRRAVARGVLLALRLERDGHAHEVLALNDAAGRRSLEALRRDPAVVAASPPPEAPAAAPNIFALYEQVIGMINPIIAEELKEAEQAYPPQWVAEAFQIAAEHNVRRWRYVRAILERWASEGRGPGRGGEHGESGRHPAAVDPKEYLRSYGRLARG